MSRIVWTHEEKRALQDTMINFIAFNPNLTNKELLRRAQEQCLPYERRQKITDQRVFNYKGMIKAARDTVSLASTRADTLALRTKVDREQPVSVPMEHTRPSLGGLFEQLVDAITQRVMDRVLARLSEQTEALPRATLDNAFGGPLDKLDDIFDSLYPEFKKAPIVPRKPTCLIIGLNGAQMQSIRDRVKHVDFKFLTAEEAVSHYKCVKDHTILMTKFLNHSAQGKYRKHPNLHYCNGGVSELNTLLNGIFNKEAT